MLPLQLHLHMVRLSSRIKSSQVKSSWIRTINRRPRLTIPAMFKILMWVVKEPTHYSKRVGREVPGVVAVLLSSKM